MSIELKLSDEEKTILLLLLHLPRIKLEGLVELQQYYGHSALNGELLKYLLNEHHAQWFEDDILPKMGFSSPGRGPLFQYPANRSHIPYELLEPKAKEEYERARWANRSEEEEARRRIYILERVGLVQIDEIEIKHILRGIYKVDWVRITSEGKRIAERIIDGRLLIARARLQRRTKIFVACAFNRQDVNQLYESVFVPLCKSVNFEPIRIDLTEPSATITDAILKNIQEAYCVIADLTYARPSVYFEVGFSNGLGVPLLLTCRADHQNGESEDRKIHFDLEQYKISFWKQQSDGSITWSKKMHPEKRLGHILQVSN